MEQQHFLLISKDMALYGAIAAAFADEGWLLHQTTTAVEGVAKIKKHSYSGILWDFDATPLDTILATLDVMRQMMNGPIIIMGEAFKPKVRRKLFRFHADDCLPRSLNDAELLVPLIRQRLWVYSQLNSEESSNNKPRRPHRDDVTIGNLRLDFDHRCVYVNDQKVILTPKEFKLLKYLYDNRNQVISREQLLNGVWNYDILGTSRMVDIHISHLRDKIEKDPHRPEWIKTARGFGYLFDAAHLDK